jgi:hypothetical protein
MGTAWRVSGGLTARLLFVAVVTSYLLGRLFDEAVAAVEVLVYGGTAALGLEFLVSSWRDLWHRR